MENRTDHKTVPPGDVSAGDEETFDVGDEYRRLTGIETTNGPSRTFSVITEDDNVVDLIGPVSGSIGVDMETELVRGDTLRVRYNEAGTESGCILEVRRDRPLVDRIVDGLRGVIA